LKKAVTTTLVLRYYNLKEEVTIQCDASQSGLGAALTQNGQPVAYASRALTPAETRYARIEKKMLAIVFTCTRFEPYIFGRDGNGRNRPQTIAEHCNQTAPCGA